MMEGYFHKWKKSYNAIDVVITPSDFYRRKFIEFGVDSNRVIHVPNFLEKGNIVVKKNESNQKYFLYFGRLSEEKGVLTLIKAVENMDIILYIVGTGPLKEKIEKYISENKINNIWLLGFKSGEELLNIVADAKAVIIPSEWYENGPYSAIEALQLGRPIIGANIGGIPELIKGNGALFESGNSKDLRDKINWINTLDNELYRDLEQKSYQLFDTVYTWQNHYEKLLSIYNNILGNRSEVTNNK
jgi:glycosyltransferase involved in cell wall biosynthesis